MRRLDIEQGDREVQPGQGTKRGSAGAGAKARRAERRRVAQADTARVLTKRIDTASSERAAAWADTHEAHPNLVEALTGELGDLFAGKRARVADDLEDKRAA